MNPSEVRLRWYHLTPGRVVVGLLALEGLLLVSERFGWFAFNRHKGWTVLIAAAAVGTILSLTFLWFLAALLFRLRFQFSIRSLLLLTLVVAVLCSWLAVQGKQAREQREAVKAIEKLGGTALNDLELEPPNGPLQRAEPPAWLRKLLGDDFFRSVTDVSAWARRSHRCRAGVPQGVAAPSAAGPPRYPGHGRRAGTRSRA